MNSLYLDAKTLDLGVYPELQVAAVGKQLGILYAESTG